MRWFTSDLHFWHTNILKFSSIRHKWKSEEEMNEELVLMWNSSVSPNDIVYNLGDLAFKVGSKMDNINSLTARLNGKHIMIKGNHDPSKKIPLFQNIAEWHKEMFLNIQGVDFLLTHFPYKDAMRDDDLIERPDCFTPDKWANGKIIPLIHGHVHDCFVLRKNCLNVGYDAWGKMVSEDEIIKIYNETKGFQNLETDRSHF